MENVETEWCHYTPTFDCIVEMMHGVVELTVDSVSQLPQVQNTLFEITYEYDDDYERAAANYLFNISLDSDNVDEEILHNIKRRIKMVIDSNSVGPQQ